eukprot:1865635-Pleurochrysis_carterae.AAC.1
MACVPVILNVPHSSAHHLVDHYIEVRSISAKLNKRSSAPTVCKATTMSIAFPPAKQTTEADVPASPAPCAHDRSFRDRAQVRCGLCRCRAAP